MIGFIIFSSLISVILALVINYFVASMFEKIALSKGHDSSTHSFAMCFWLGIIGYLYVIALPDLKLRGNIAANAGGVAKAKAEAKVEAKVEAKRSAMDKIAPSVSGAAPSAKIYRCKDCHSIIEYGMAKCPLCGRELNWNK